VWTAKRSSRNARGRSRQLVRLTVWCHFPLVELVGGGEQSSTFGLVES